jgi:hypothetical protein
MEPPAESQSQDDNTPLMKPKRTRTMTPEAKQQYAERMRKVNQDRCEKARLKSEETLALKEQKLKEKMEQIESKKQQVKKLKEDKQLVEPNVPDTPEPKPVKDKPLKKQKARRIVVQESSDSDDYYNDDVSSSSGEDEVIYVAKKPKKQPKPQTITKAKKEKDIPVRQPEVPKTIIKFF